jgi:hypothetical protein
VASSGASSGPNPGSPTLLGRRRPFDLQMLSWRPGANNRDICRPVPPAQISLEVMLRQHWRPRSGLRVGGSSRRRRTSICLNSRAAGGVGRWRAGYLVTRSIRRTARGTICRVHHAIHLGGAMLQRRRKNTDILGHHAKFRSSDSGSASSRYEGIRFTQCEGESRRRHETWPAWKSCQHVGPQSADQWPG